MLNNYSHDLNKFLPCFSCLVKVHRDSETFLNQLFRLHLSRTVPNPMKNTKIKCKGNQNNLLTIFRGARCTETWSGTRTHLGILILGNTLTWRNNESKCYFKVNKQNVNRIIGNKSRIFLQNNNTQTYVLY